MAKDLKMLLKVCAVRMYGDIGPLTVWSRKNRDLVFYNRSPPDKPPSPLQRFYRERWKVVMADWRAISKIDKDLWESISIRTGVPFTGLNLFIMMETRDDMRIEITNWTHEAGYSAVPSWQIRG